MASSSSRARKAGIVGRWCLDLNQPPIEDGPLPHVKLEKDNKSICRTKCANLPFVPPAVWQITDIVRQTPKYPNSGFRFPQCQLYPDPENAHERREWKLFMTFLWKHKMFAMVKYDTCEFRIHAPSDGPDFPHALVSYQLQNERLPLVHQEVGTLGNAQNDAVNENVEARNNAGASTRNVNTANDNIQNNIGSSPEASARVVNTVTEQASAQNRDASLASRHPQNNVESVACERCEESQSHPPAGPSDAVPEKKSPRIHPSYLETLSQAHGAWIFGAIAEFIDNSRDANANRVDISIESLYLPKEGHEIPVLSIIDDGHGMSHDEMMRMVSFGHEQPINDNPDQIGRFGIGFKTGSMKLGKDVLVLTQTSTSRTIALLSQLFNEGKLVVEIPMVTFAKHGKYMLVDTNIQSQVTADTDTKVIKEFSPFNEYFIGEKLGLFGEKGTGTQIYIWNLDKWGSQYTLEWSTPNTDGSTQGDILIRSRRIRSRLGQLSQKVPLDYSLQAYLEVIFLVPRMKITVQGSQVNSRPLGKTLNKTSIVKGEVLGKPIQLVLGRSQEEWERMNCGIFLYWHGRLIEAYKRVGSMVHAPELGRGVIGVLDVTNLMDAEGGRRVWVLNTKQGFQDCEAYAKLEEWLGRKSDEYWDNNFDVVEVKRKTARYKQDDNWVQCDKCRKWRKLSRDFDVKTLPKEWFCYMPPFDGRCDVAEQEVGDGVITVATRRSGYDDSDDMSAQLEDPAQKELSSIAPSPNKQRHQRSNISVQETQNTPVNKKKHNRCSTPAKSRKIQDNCNEDAPKSKPPFKRLRRGPSRSCKQS